MRLRYHATLNIAWLTFACGPAIRQPTPNPDAAAVVVLDDATLARLSGYSVLDAITLRLPQVHTAWAAGGCPEILLRGTDGLMGSSNADVYVDHAHALNTCALSTLLATDVRRVEIYPLGVTQRPGYPAAAHGLILVFTRGSRAQ